MRPGPLSTKPLLATIVGLAMLGCSSGSGSDGSQPAGSGGVGHSSSQSGGGSGSSASSKPGSSASGGTSSASSAGGSTGTTGPAGGSSATSSSSQRPEGGSTGGRSETGGASTGGRTGSAGQGGTVTGVTAGGSSGAGGTGGAGGSTSKGGQGGGTGGSASGGRTGGSTGMAGQTASTRPIAFGTLLNAQGVIDAAQQLAKSASNPSSPQWQAKGDQHRTYHFAEANADEPYRLYVPTNWDGKAQLPLVMFLHGSGNDENSYIDSNNKQLITLAQQHGFILVGPLGASGAYGNFLRLTAPFGNQAAADQLMAQVTTDTERTNELSEKDVINVLELVLNEYPVDRGAVFLTGHSMGSGGTWYIGGKYASYWTAIGPMSGPFVQETGYPWDALRNMPIFVTEGTQAPSLDASHVLRDWLKKNNFKAEYKEVNADHPGMVPLVLPDEFDFFDRANTK